MGSAASKTSQSTARRLPVQNAAKRLQRQNIPSSSSPASVHPPTLPSFTKSDEILKDSQDPHFSSMLRTLGTVSHQNAPTPPTPSSHPSPTFPPPRQPRHHQPSLSPTLLILQSRESQSEAISECPQNYLDIFRIRDVVMMREGINLNGGDNQRKMRDDEIEKRLGLKRGILATLGSRVGHTGVQIREDKEVEGVKEGEPVVEFVSF
ncbi:uncharacterized protein DFL_002899 [Arthrobotrys flagrans]|uniref:Helix-turn-helix domain-containing protein n=1 Tax=Arthrobotrys flagrans TaxID=97331 RepID=A0A437ABU3_ARTFL|nr:hypothetical protein DFL_002899 [Arthrobotrys flagrans]